MVGGGDDDELFRLRQRGHHRLQSSFGGELVARTTYEQFRFCAGLQVIVIVGAIVDRRDGCAETDQRNDSGIRTRRSQTNSSTEREAREYQRQMKFVVEPIERNADVVDFSHAIIVLA